MLRLRVLTAVVGLPIVGFIFWSQNKWLILLLFTVCATLCSFESLAMLLGRQVDVTDEAPHPNLKRFIIENPKPFIALLIAVLVLGAQIVTSLQPGVFYAILVALLASSMLMAVKPQDIFNVSSTLVFSLVYGAMPWAAIWMLYRDQPGVAGIVFVLAVIWSGDTGAYFGGSYLGKHKLAPSLSPKKTWEGALFGLLSSMVAAILVNAIFGGILGSLLTVAIAGCVGGIFGQLGDLFESSIKRSCNVKDSGKIFPGHGGLLDRVDGLLFAGPVIWVILYGLSGIG